MLRTYAAIFEDDSEKQRCKVSIPNLSYESEIDYATNKELLKQAEDELSFALWLYEERETGTDDRVRVRVELAAKTFQKSPDNRGFFLP